MVECRGVEEELGGGGGGVISLSAYRYTRPL